MNAGERKGVVCTLDSVFNRTRRRPQLTTAEIERFIDLIGYEFCLEFARAYHCAR